MVGPLCALWALWSSEMWHAALTICISGYLSLSESNSGLLFNETGRDVTESVEKVRLNNIVSICLEPFGNYSRLSSLQTLTSTGNARWLLNPIGVYGRKSKSKMGFRDKQFAVFKYLNDLSVLFRLSFTQNHLPDLIVLEMLFAFQAQYNCLHSDH